jgi:N utilization substance protein A
LGGEKIDIVRWNESQEVYIMNAMKPAIVNAIELDFDNKHSKVFVEEDQLSLAIGRRGQNVRLASRLTGWAIDLVTGTPDAYEERFQVEYDPSRDRPTVSPSPAEAAAAILPEAPEGDYTEEQPQEYQTEEAQQTEQFEGQTEEQAPVEAQAMAEVDADAGEESESGEEGRALGS